MLEKILTSTYPIWVQRRFSTMLQLPLCKSRRSQGYISSFAAEIKSSRGSWSHEHGLWKKFMLEESKRLWAICGIKTVSSGGGSN